MPKQKQYLEVDDRQVPVSNLHKILFPEGRITKAKVIEYYLEVSDVLLPHLRDRPVTLKRYPNGALGEFFYEKDAPSFTPEWVETYPVPRREGGTIRYIVVNDRPTLAWLANLANLEIHPFLHRAPHLDRPTAIVFDLDPGKGADVLTCARVAFLLRDLLARFELQTFPKVSGSKGLQVYVPLNANLTYAVTQPFAKAIADMLATQHPELIVADMAKALRTKKVFIDWSQNADFKTTVGVYSLRAKTGEPFVSVPVTWNELEAAVEKKKAEKLYFGISAVLKRIEKHGDLFSGILTLKQKLPSAVLEYLSAETPESLTPYEEKRDFTRYAEPARALVRRRRQGGRRRFVIRNRVPSAA